MAKCKALTGSAVKGLRETIAVHLAGHWQSGIVIGVLGTIPRGLEENQRTLGITMKVELIRTPRNSTNSTEGTGAWLKDIERQKRR